MKRFVIYIGFILLIVSCGEGASFGDGFENTFDEITDEIDDESFDETTDEIVDDPVAAVYELLEAEEAKDLIDERKDDQVFHIIDVRTVSEYDGGHIPNADNYNIYDSEFSGKISEFSLSDVLLVYCASGSRSKGAVATMQSLGFLEIYELKSGISSWKNAGYSVEVH